MSSTIPIASLSEPRLRDILYTIGVKTQRKTIDALRKQTILALNNNATLLKLETVTDDSNVSDSYFNTPDFVVFLRKHNKNEQTIADILSLGITTRDSLEVLNDDIINKLKTTTSVKDALKILVEDANSCQYDPSPSTHIEQTTPIRHNSPPPLPHPVKLFSHEYRDDRKWKRMQPQQLRESDDFFQWIKEVEWKLVRFDPSGELWVELTEELLTGNSQEVSEYLVSRGYKGRSYIEQLRQHMTSRDRCWNAYLQIISNKWKIGDNCRDHFMKFKREYKLIDPTSSDKSAILFYLSQLPIDMTRAIMRNNNHNDIEDFIAEFTLEAHRKETELQSNNNKRTPVMRNDSRNNDSVDSMSNTNNRQRNRNPRNPQQANRNARNNNNNNNNSPNRNQTTNNQSNNSNPINYNRNNNRSNYNRNRNYNNNRGQNSNVNNPLPGTSNSNIPSTPQLRAQYNEPINCPQNNVQPQVPLSNQSIDTHSSSPSTSSYRSTNNRSDWTRPFVDRQLYIDSCLPITRQEIFLSTPSTVNTHNNANRSPLGSDVNSIQHSNLNAHHNYTNEYNLVEFYPPSNSSRSINSTNSSHYSEILKTLSNRSDYYSCLLSELMTNRIHKRNLNKSQIVDRLHKSYKKIIDPMPEVDITFHRPDVTFRALIDTGASISILPGSVCEYLNLPIIPCHVKISGINGQSQAFIPRGFTLLLIQIGPDTDLTPQPFYVVNELDEPILLGRDFTRWSNLNIQSCNNGFIVRRSVARNPNPLRHCDRPVLYGEIPSPQLFAETAADFTSFDIASDSNYHIRVNNVFRVKVDPLSEFDQSKFEQNLASKITHNIAHAERQCLWDVVSRHFDCFSKSKYDLGSVHEDVCNFKINIGDNEVPQCAPIRYSRERGAQLEAIVKELIDHNLVRTSRSRGCAPALLVAKRDGSLRMVVSYIELNKVTRRTYYPIPHIDDFITAVQGFKYFAILDLAQGYYQIRIPESERHKTAFCTQNGKYEFNVLPMGLADAPAIFVSLMNTIFGDLREIVQVYFDDILVKGRTINELAHNLDIVMHKLREYNLKLKWEKCQFGVTELVYLGHFITGETVRPDPSKVHAISRMAIPKTLRQLQSLLGTFNHYSRYVPDYATIVAPLYRLTAKARKFKLEKSDVEIISKIKNCLAQDCLLSIYNPDLPVRLLVDASNIAVAGILEQQEESGWRAVSYFGQKLNKHEKNYTVSEKECLAVILAVQKYKHFLEGRSFVIVSDHHALCSLAKTSYKVERLNRWATLLSQFDYKIIYSKGLYHPADCFTRAVEWDHRKTEILDDEDLICFYSNEEQENILSKTPESVVIANAYFITNLIVETIDRHLGDTSVLDNQWTHNQVLKIVSHTPFQRNELSSEQFKDSSCKCIINELQNKVESDFNRKFEYIEGILFRKPTNKRKSRIVLPLSLKDKIIDYYHSGSAGLHYGVNKTYELIAQFFWCKELKEWVKSKIDDCQKCQCMKKAISVGNCPSVMPIAERPMERIQIDVVGRFPESRSKNQYIITAVDMHSGYAWARAQRRTTATELIKFMEDIRLEKGLPKFLHSDNGKNFVSHQFQNYLSNQGIQHIRSTYYHPQSQGRVERLNGTLNDRIRTTSLVDRWDEELKEILFQMNATPNSADTPSPFFLMHGYEPTTVIQNKLNLPNIDRKDINIERHLANQRRAANQTKVLLKRAKSAVPPKIKFGDIVKLKIMQSSKKQGKLTPKYSLNTFVVIKVNSNSTAKLVDLKTLSERVENFSRLKKVRGRKPANYSEVLSKYKESSTLEIKQETAT